MSETNPTDPAVGTTAPAINIPAINTTSGAAPTVDTSVAPAIQAISIPLDVYESIIEVVARVRMAVSGAKVRGMDVFAEVIDEHLTDLEDKIKGLNNVA